jgi:hypothetical protein
MMSRPSLLFASTALSVAIGLPALAAAHAEGSTPGLCPTACARVLGDADHAVPLRVSDDDDDDHDDGHRARRGHHDDDDDEDDDCDDDDGDGCNSARVNPAPAGTAAPPANGLFGNGAPPVAVTR